MVDRTFNPRANLNMYENIMLISLAITSYHWSGWLKNLYHFVEKDHFADLLCLLIN